MPDSATTSSVLRELEQQYRAALEEFLQANDREARLRNARDVGRQALEKRVGILELGAIHRKVLRGFLDHAGSSNTAGTIERSMDFFLESLTPFDRANREKEEFLAALSHDLRNPLGPILGWARILKNQPMMTTDEMLAEGIRSMERNAELIQRLIDRCLDLAHASPGKKSPSTPDSLRPKIIRVLLVEDAPDVLFLMKEELEWSGFIVYTAQDGDAGLEIAKREIPDLIVSDIRMPGMDGYEFLEKLRAIPSLASTPAIALTGLGMERDAEQTRAFGYTSHMVKPVNIEQLINLITNLTLNLSGKAHP